MSLKNKLIFVIIILVVVPMLFVGLLLFNQVRQYSIQKEFNNFALAVDQKVQLLNVFYDDFKSHVSIFAATPPIQGIIRSSASGFDTIDQSTLEQWHQRLSVIASIEFEEKPDIIQIRIIDHKGNEIFRIDHTGGNIKTIDDHQLQNKKDRYYFQETIKLSEGQVYISPIDLNEEFGKVQVPHLPVARFASPIFDERDGSQAGIVIFNVEMGGLLKDLELVNVGDSIVFDQDGRFLVHPDQTKLFANQTNQKYNYYDEQLELKANIALMDEKKHYDQEEREFRVWRKFYYSRVDKEKFLVILMRVHEDILLAPIMRIRRIFMAFLLTTVAISSIIAWLLASSIISPLQRLDKTAKKVSGGKLDENIESHLLSMDDEIGDLAKSIDKMTRKLLEANFDLEKKVEERTENLLKITDELKRSNVDLEQFAYVASHDLQEPLRMVASFTGLLQKRYQGKLDETADKYINFSVDGAKRMQVLINDLLAYSRLEKKVKPFKLVDCNDVLKSVIDNLKISIHESGAKITRASLPVVSGDETQLIQLFQNIVGNAIKYRGEQAPEIDIAIKEDDGQWLFSIKDNGIGISEEYAEKVFVIFQRLHERDKYSGTGIGLAVCKKIVERHGGRIWVKPNKPGGSIFYFKIPKLNNNKDIL